MVLHVFRRIGLLRRRWVWCLLLVAGIVLAGYWMVPWRGPAAELQLVALRPDGTFAQTVVGVPHGTSRGAVSVVDSLDAAPFQARQGVVRRGVPLVLGIANAGSQPGRPERLTLAFPRWYRLVDPGPEVRREASPDEALQRYVIETDFPLIRAGRVPTLLPVVDTLWIEPWVPDYYCTADVDSVPRLMPSVPPDTAGPVEVRIFYSFEGENLQRRQTGLLVVELPEEMFPTSSAPDIAQGPVEMMQPHAQRPEMGVLISGGSREAECGPPGDPMRLFSALWLTADSGRMISVHYGGQARKEFYDLDRDSIIELEMWDPDGDGEMEAWRRVRLAIPEYLLPEPPPAPVVVAFDSLAADSLAAAYDSTIAPGDAPMTGAAPALAELNRMLLPGDPATARRLFVRRAPAPPRPDDGALGIPLDQRPEAVPGEPPVAEPQPEPETPEPEPREQEPAPPPNRKVPIGQPVN